MPPRRLTVREEELDLVEEEQEARAIDRALGFGERSEFTPRSAFSSDPSQLGWPPTLCIELALHPTRVKATCLAHGVDHDEWLAIKDNPVFQAELKRTVEGLRKDGATFKARAGLQAIEMLKTSWALVHNPSVPASVRADLIGKTVKWAGLDASRDQAAAAKANGFSIVINLA